MKPQPPVFSLPVFRTVPLTGCAAIPGSALYPVSSECHGRGILNFRLDLSRPSKHAQLAILQRPLAPPNRLAVKALSRRIVPLHHCFRL